jgi:hypothetical protein
MAHLYLKKPLWRQPQRLLVDSRADISAYLIEFKQVCEPLKSK